MGNELLSVNTYVESPFIYLTIGPYTFGKATKSISPNSVNVTFPNFMERLSIQKINGQVNTYTIDMVYGITETDDPNLLDKVFSSVGLGSKIYITYGDSNAPENVYREEQAILIKVTSHINFAQSKISYTLTATGVTQLLAQTYNNFSGRNEKPSTVLTEMLTQPSYGLQEVFTGMADTQKILTSGVISRDDQTVQIPAKQNMSTFDYMKYLVNSMIPINQDSSMELNDSYYRLNVVEDNNKKFGGPYFEVKKISQDQPEISTDYYSIDVGYPSQNFVVDFQIQTNEAYSLYYEFSEKINQNNYAYRLDDNGKWQVIKSPKISSVNKYNQTTPASNQWWSKMVNFPISASITIKGLVKPSLLMQYLKINTYFYGNQHTSSGLYIVTSQQDTVSSQGYRTTLGLTRISG